MRFHSRNQLFQIFPSFIHFWAWNHHRNVGLAVTVSFRVFFILLVVASSIPAPMLIHSFLQKIFGSVLLKKRNSENRKKDEEELDPKNGWHCCNGLPSVFFEFLSPIPPFSEDFLTKKVTKIAYSGAHFQQRNVWIGLFIRLQFWPRRDRSVLFNWFAPKTMNWCKLWTF